MVDWLSLHHTLSQDWDFHVAFGYRRYPEWMVSSYQQINRWKGAKPKMNKWPGQGGKALSLIEPLPNSKKTRPHMVYRYTDHLQEEMHRFSEIVTSIITCTWNKV